MAKLLGSYVQPYRTLLTVVPIETSLSSLLLFLHEDKECERFCCCLYLAVRRISAHLFCMAANLM